MGLEPAEERDIADERAFDDLGEPGAQFPLGQRAQRSRVREDAERLMKSADQILPAG
jgi:hypothetical protein